MAKWTKDRYGYIGQATKIIKNEEVTSLISSGDALNWNSHLIYLDGPTAKTVDDLIKDFQPLPGVWIRHFDESQGIWNHYYKKGPVSRFYDGIISRDQLTGLLAVLIKKEKWFEVLKIILHALPRLLLFAYNFREYDDPKKKWRFPDLTGFGIWAMYLRGLGPFSWLFWPLLVILDGIYIIDTLLFNFQKDEIDNISYLIKVFVANERIPTPTARIAWWLMNKDKAVKDLEAYWCDTVWRGNCGMVELYTKKIFTFNKKFGKNLLDFLKKMF